VHDGTVGNAAVQIRPHEGKIGAAKSGNDVIVVHLDISSTDDCPVYSSSLRVDVVDNEGGELAVDLVGAFQRQRLRLVSQEGAGDDVEDFNFASAYYDTTRCMSSLKLAPCVPANSNAFAFP
jgi:hypothetical protein